MISRFISAVIAIVIVCAHVSAGEGSAADTGKIISMRGRKAVRNGIEYRGYEGLRPLFVVARDPRPMALLLKSRENFILGVSLTVAGCLMAGLMAPVLYDPGDYALAPPRCSSFR